MTSSEQQQVVRDGAEQILEKIEGAPKSMRRKMRARVKEKVP